MESRHLRTILRHAAAVAGKSAIAPAADADLLARFRDGRDEAAFAELVNRYGRLVLAVCRNLLPAEADAADAFQAVFLALVQHSDRIRDAAKLGPWLHGVAYRVCWSARRQAMRRKNRERAAARTENGRAVPDSAWDSAMAAVHEEVSLLPDSLRVPFVLCCLEGKGATEAAAQLGWKLGTLSGRLTRAKAKLLARLDKRGLAIGAAALALGASASAGVPRLIAQRAAGLIRDASAVPSSIIHLSQGAIGMTVYRTKLMVAAIVLAVAGLTTTVGTGWLSKAGAQPEPKDKAQVRDVAAEALDLYGDAIVKAPPAEQKSPWMFKFEPFAAGAPPKGLADATKRLRLAAAAGWEFSGTMEMTLSPDDYVRLAETKGVKPSSNAVYRVYVYKRPANQQLHVDRTDDLKQSVDLFRAVEGSDADAVKRLHALRLLAENQRDQDALQAERRAANDARAELQKLNALTAEKKAAAALNDQSKRDAIFEEKTKYSADLEQHIKKLQAELDALKADKAVEGVTVKPDKANQSIVLKLKTLDPEDLVRAVEAAAAKKFGKNALRIVPERTSMSIMLYGQPEAIKWATELIGKFDN